MKQKYEEKRIIDICGVLDIDDDEGYVIIVNESKDDETKTYPLIDILKKMEGQIVNIKSSVY